VVDVRNDAEVSNMHTKLKNANRGLRY
jgi:hypothetical protein